MGLVEALKESMSVAFLAESVLICIPMASSGQLANEFLQFRLRVRNVSRKKSFRKPAVRPPPPPKGAQQRWRLSSTAGSGRKGEVLPQSEPSLQERLRDAFSEVPRGEVLPQDRQALETDSESEMPPVTPWERRVRLRANSANRSTAEEAAKEAQIPLRLSYSPERGTPKLLKLKASKAFFPLLSQKDFFLLCGLSA